MMFFQQHINSANNCKQKQRIGKYNTSDSKSWDKVSNEYKYKINRIHERGALILKNIKKFRSKCYIFLKHFQFILF